MVRIEAERKVLKGTEITHLLEVHHNNLIHKKNIVMMEAIEVEVEVEVEDLEVAVEVVEEEISEVEAEVVEEVEEEEEAEEEVAQYKEVEKKTLTYQVQELIQIHTGLK